MKMGCKKEKVVTICENEGVEETTFIYSLENEDGVSATVKSVDRIPMLKKGSTVEFKTITKQTEVRDHK